MNRRSTFTLTTIALIFSGAALPWRDAIGQQTLQQQIIGTWAYVAVDTVKTDGSREPIYGPNPKGLAMFDADGRYMLLTARAGQPRFASSNRLEGTPEENKGVVHGSIAHFGRYAVNEADKTITFQIDTSTFPNWNGTQQKRPVTLNGDELKWTTPASSGGSAEVVLKRAR
jgi:hypothetical protein